MPMYEYACKDCGYQFTLLRRMNQADSDIVCEQCGTGNIERMFSLFASHSKDKNGVTSSIAGGGCSGGVCNTGSCNSGICGCG